MSPPATSKEPPLRSPLLVLLLAAISVVGVGLFAQTILESPDLSLAFFSSIRWQSILADLGGRVASTAKGTLVSVPFATLAGIAIVVGSAVALAGVAFDRSRVSFIDRFISGVWRLSLAWLPAGLWWLLWMAALLANWPTFAALLQETADLTAATCLALTALCWSPAFRLPINSGTPPTPLATVPTPNRRARLALIAGMTTYVIVFTAMNWGLWFNLRLPHGDSAMYEEHLWNLEHGKGFRSELDQGLFLGEHLQVVHVLLVPLHLLFPSHLTLELAQSVILALGAWPVFNIARRHSGSEWAAALLGLAYLAYFPLQYLDIAIDLKTFRPNSFGIPTLLAAIDLLERRRYGWATVWLALTLSAQEDWAIPLSLVGLYFALESVLSKRVAGAGPTNGREAPGQPPRTTPSPRRPPDSSTASAGEKVPAGRMRGHATAESPSSRPQLLYGLSLFTFGLLYLWFALNVAIPWFRGGATVHTASYFSRFGNSPREILVTLLTRPTLLWSTIVTPAALVYALRLLLPLGFLPLRSPGRLLTAAPLFLLLLMNDLAMQTPAPVHHFHATLIPLLFWAAAAGLGDGRAKSTGY